MLAAVALAGLSCAVQISISRTQGLVEEGTVSQVRGTEHKVGISRMRVSARTDLPLRMLDVLTYTNVTIGSNTLSLIVDTGSSTLAAPSDLCPGCLVRCPTCAYVSKASPTCEPLPCNATQCPSHHLRPCAAAGPCGFAVQYADGTGESGDIVEEVVTWGPFSASIHIGRIRTQSPPDSFARLGVDGILGIAGRDLNFAPTQTPTLMDAILKGQAMPDLFAMSIGEQGGESGVLHLGEVDTGHFPGNLSYTPMEPETWYIVHPEAMSIGGRIVASSEAAFGAMTIVDSGTTFSFLPRGIFNEIKYVLQTEYRDLPHVWSPNGDGETIFSVGQCFTNVPLEKFPVLKIRFSGGAIAEIPATSYFTTATNRAVPEDQSIYYCFGLAPSGKSDNEWSIGDSQSIFGDTVMSALYVVFDRENRRLGFANTHAARRTLMSLPSWNETGMGSAVQPHDSLSSMFPPVLVLVLATCFCVCFVSYYRRSHEEEYQDHSTSLSPSASRLTESKKQSNYGTV